MSSDEERPEWETDASDSDGKSLLQKALFTGLSAVMLTEEGIRNALGDLRVPKETIGNLMQQTERSRKEIFQTVSGELKGFLRNVDTAKALRKALIGLKLEVKADIRFVDDGKVESDVKTKVKDIVEE